MDSAYKVPFAFFCKQYEMAIWERSRRARIAAERTILNLGYEADYAADARLEARIERIESILNLISEL